MELLEIVPKIQDCLKQAGVSARVVVKGKNTLEVRIEATDLMSESFEIKRPSIKTHATIRPYTPPRNKQEKKEEAPKGFNLKLVAHKDSMADADLKALHELTKNYSFISATKLDSKVWENTCREVVWLASGLFADSHKWDSTWITKTNGKGGGPDMVVGRFTDVPSVIQSIAQCLDYVKDAHSQGSFWWPQVVNGKIPRQSIASFLVSMTRAGTEWSPFCEILWEMNKTASIKNALPRMAVSVAEAIIKDSQYLSSLPVNALASYWDGLRKFVNWYNDKRDVLIKDINNRVRLADIGAAVTLTKEWNASASGRAMPCGFIYPGSDKWFRFTQWCKTYRNVVIPDYRGNING